MLIRAWCRFAFGVALSAYAVFSFVQAVGSRLVLAAALHVGLGRPVSAVVSFDPWFGASCWLTQTDNGEFKS